jgi:hypothetical protein
MKDHEIVLKREKKLNEIKRAVTGPSYTNTEEKNINPSLFHTILHPEIDDKGGNLCHQKRQ